MVLTLIRINLMRSHGHARGYRRTPTLSTYDSLFQRCYNKKNPNYRDYGGRGITVCERWRSFENFLEDMGERPEGQFIERIDNNLGYEPGNCRWATNKEQARNRRSTHLITFRGETLCLKDWAERLSINRGTLTSRLKLRGWTVDKALTKPVHKMKVGLLSFSKAQKIRSLYASGKFTQCALADRFGISFQQVSAIVLGKIYTKSDAALADKGETE